MVDHAPEQTGLMTIGEFVRLYDLEGPFELVGGERRPVSPTVAGHGSKAKRIYDALILRDPDQIIGMTYFDLPFVLTDTLDWVKGSRIPDVMYFRAERFRQYTADHPDWEDKPFILVPDVVVEVISTHDSYSEVDEKVDRYLEDGVKLVWVVDPRRKVITVRGAAHYAKLTLDDTLTGGDVIPGFQLAVRAIFE